MEKSNLFTKDKSKSKLVFGLDLGTTNSVLTISKDGGVPKVLSSKSGKTTPSCVRFNEDGSIDIGSEPYTNRQDLNVAYSFKQYMGTGKLVHGDRTARDLASIFVKNLVEECVELNPEFKEVTKIQVSTPAYFDMNQLQDTRLAIEEAGFEVVGMNSEPLAAALVYQELKKVIGDILVFDLGGGTFDVVLIRNRQGVSQDTINFYEDIGYKVPKAESLLEIIDTAGNNNLGGDDIDKIAAGMFMQDNNLTNLSETDKRAVVLAAERLKKAGSGKQRGVLGNLTMDYEYIQKAVETVFDRCMEIVQTVLKRNTDIDLSNLQCVLCGGSTKNEYIRQQLGYHFSVSHEIDPDLAVGIGDSIKATIDARNDGVQIVSRLAKGVGLLGDGRINYLANKGAILPLVEEVSFTNETPFAEYVTIKLYQGDKYLEEPVHICSLKLGDIKSFDENGKAKLRLTLTIDSNGVISVKASHKDMTVEQKLELTPDDDKQEETSIHPDARFYPKFKKAADHYNDPHLTNLVEEYASNGSKNLAKEIMSLMSSLANNK